MKRTLKNLIMLRRNRSISQTILSQNMNISRGELSIIERGKRQLTFDKIGKYINAINIDDGLSSNEKSDLIEAVLSDFIEVLTHSLPEPDSINVSISKNVLNNKSEIIAILLD